MCGLDDPYFGSWIDCEQSNKPNCMLAWLIKPNKPNIVWLVNMHPDKPNLVLAWLDSLINPTRGWLDCVCCDLAMCKSIVP